MTQTQTTLTLARPRLRQICLAAPALQPLVSQLQTLFGLGEPYRDPHVAKWGLDNAVFALGHQFLEIVAPVRDDAPLHRFLARHPDGAGYIVILDNDDVDARRAHLQRQGARLVTDLGHDGFHTLQVHPRDAGACMLEFDRTDGGEAWDGPYAPGGPQWQQQVRRDRIAGFAGVVLRGADAAALAARWSALIGIGLGTDGAGRARISLDGGDLVFGAATADAPEGLAEILLHASDAPAVLRDAAALGIAVQPGAQRLLLCGVGVTLLPTPR